jgi:hypothetical protein
MRGRVAVGAQADQSTQTLNAGPVVEGPSFMGLQPASVVAVGASVAAFTTHPGTPGDHRSKALPVGRVDTGTDVREPA